MFVSADIVMKVVMLGLALASVLTWAIWLAKTFELVFARRSLALAQQSHQQSRELRHHSEPAR
jgi:biopolymer transport protein ExbB